MFQLSPPPEPEWLTLIEADGDTPAVRVLFAPIGQLAREAASAAVSKLLAAADPDLREEIREAVGEDGKVTGGLSDGAEALLRDVGRASARALIREGVREWEGIGDPDGAPLAVTPRSIGWFLANDRLYALADRLYVLPDALRDAEKNGSAGSLAGIGMRATPGLDTASSRAIASKKAAAATRKPTKRDARTSSTARKAKRA